MRLLFATILALLGLPLLGALMGAVQLAWYRLRRTPADDIPFFGILMLRGMILGFALVAAATIASHMIAGK